MRLMGYWQSMLRKRLRENINLKLRENLSLIYSNKLFKRSEPLLIPRIDGGGGGGCPIAAFGITDYLYDKNS